MDVFKNLAYSRPDGEKVKSDLHAQLEALKNAGSYEEAKAAFFRRQDIMTEFRTMNVIASIRADINTADEFYAGEMKFFHDLTPRLSVILKEFNEALAASPYRADFEKEYGDLLFKILDADIRTNSKDIIDEKIAEAGLVTEYSKTAASCKTMFRGEECNFYGLLKHMLSTDREERKEAMMAWADLYEGASARLEDIYGRLCELRRTEAAKLGFNNFIEMAYLSRHRFDYTSADIEKFRNAVQKYIVPAAAKIRAAQ